MIGYAVGTIIYMLFYGGLYYLISIGIFDTEYSKQQYRLWRFVYKSGENEITSYCRGESELVSYKKKWWQPYRIEPLPDKIVFESDEVKKIWEKITND